MDDGFDKEGGKPLTEGKTTTDNKSIDEDEGSMRGKSIETEELSLPLERLAAMHVIAFGNPGEKTSVMPPVDNLLQEATVQTVDLRAENQELQKRVVLYAKRRSSINAQLFMEGHDTEYQASLIEWAETKSKLEHMRADYERRTDVMREQLGKKEIEAEEAQANFQALKWKVAREAEHSVYGRMLSRSMLDKVFNARTLCHISNHYWPMHLDDKELDLEREAARIQGRQLKSQLARLEQALKRKDQLLGGLHLVDYEQLKMENEVMTEKLATKNEEISKLKKKTTYVVHVVTHLREKLQQVQKDVEVESEALEAVERDLLKRRGDLQEINARCTVLRLKKSRLQKNVVNITNPMLLDDLELHKEEAEALEKRIGELQNHFNLLQMQIHEQTAILRAYSLIPNIIQTRSDHDVGRQSKRIVKDFLRWGVYRKRPITKHCPSAY